MKNSKGKLLLISALFVLMILSFLQVESLATDSNILMLKENDNEYVIYVETMLNQNFEFAFSNSKDETNLSYIVAAQDGDGNYIAYVDEELLQKYFNSEDTYLWVIDTEDKIVIDGEKITLNDVITSVQLQTIENITKNITIESSAENETIKINGDEGKTYYYKIFVAGSSEEYNNLLELVEKISEYDENTSEFTRLQGYLQLSNLFNNLVSNMSSDNWIEAKNLEIAKPYDAKEGEQFILWLKDSDGNTDVQILTAYEKEITVIEEQEKTEEIITALPVTYDNTTVLFIALGTVIVAIIAVLAYKTINRKNRK